MSSLADDCKNEINKFMEEWTSKHTESGYDPIPFLTKSVLYCKLLKLILFWLTLHTYIFLRLSVKFEDEIEEFHKQDPDPFDDRHPG